MRRMHRSDAPSGFTVVELLVVMGVVGVLIGLLIPAVQAAREAARRARCLASQAQLIRAVHSFETAHGVFPASRFIKEPTVPRDNRTHGHYSTHCALLPFLEEGNLYNSINFEMQTGLTVGDMEFLGRTDAKSAVAVFLCPSDPNSRRVAFTAPNSYRICVGFGETWRGRDGRFGQEGAFAFVQGDQTGLPPASFADGLSNTLAFSEKPIGSGAGGTYHPFRDWSINYARIPATPDDWVALCSSLRPDDLDPCLDAGATWMLPGGNYTRFFASAPPNTPIPDCGVQFTGGEGLFSARSYHPGGVVAAMADGSARWFSSTTSAAVWRVLATRAGGEVVSNF